MTTVILDKLSRDGLQIENCRGQAYDNAAVMAGVRTGVQQRIKEINPLAEFVPCNNHSLNLVGVHAASASVSAVTFFGTVQRCFTFFAASTHRWDVLKSNCSVTLKRAVDTRWSARKESVSCLKNVYSKVADTHEMLTNQEETQDTREEAGLLHNSLQRFSFLCFLYMWEPMLSGVDIAQKCIQQKDLDIIKCASKIRNLNDFLLSERDSLVTDAMAKSRDICEEMGIDIERRIRRRRRMPGEEAEEAALTLEQELRREMLACLDSLSQEIHQRFEQISSICDRFQFLKPSELLQEDTPGDNYSECIRKLTTTYSEISSEELVMEVKRLRRFVKGMAESGVPTESWGVVNLLQWMVQCKLQETVPNLIIAIRIYLTMAVSVASCERSFSKLKLIKAYLRSTMGQNRLTNLAILSIEREQTES